jgi:hypothetical protein
MSIAYPRAVVDTSIYDPNNLSVAAGDIAFVERVNPTKRRAEAERDVHIRIHTMKQINAKFTNVDLSAADDLHGFAAAKAIFDNFSLDGIVHAVEATEGDRSIAQTIVYGSCQFPVPESELGDIKIGDALFVGLRVTKPETEAGTHKVELFRFFSRNIGQANLPPEELAGTRLVGAVTDIQDGASAVTVEVDIDPLADLSAGLVGLGVTP